jgi:glycerol-3-phosphate dehydrogenase
VDAGDIACGTSSRSSRLVHGGLRYLQDARFHLVFEASAERHRLLGLATHLVRPLPFLFPVFRGGPVGYRKLQAGMWLYDLLALFRNIARHRMLPARRVLEAEPGLREDGLVGAALYYDAAVDDARLTMANARGAHEAGAAVVPHAAVVGFLEGDGRISGARVRDRLRPEGEPVEVRARVVLNATGPWSDEVRRLADPADPPRLRPTKGVHLMVRRERLANRHAIIFPSAVDGRIMFVLPWGEHTYVGTTDTDHPGPPSAARAEAADVRYLLDSANAIFPAARLTDADVLSTWAGVRPLMAGREGVSEGATSREHEIWRGPRGLLNIAGGKLTTYRLMARQVVDAAARELRADGVESGSSPTDHLPLPADPAGPLAAFVERTRHAAVQAGLGAAAGEHLALRHGEDAAAVLDLALRDPELARPVLPGHPYLWAEVVRAVRSEMALTLEDVLARRLHLFHEAADGGLSVAAEVAARMAGEPGIGWTAAEAERQVASYAREVEATRGFAPGS